MNSDLDSNFQFSYQRLLYFLSRPDEQGYMFCQADDQRFIQRINQSLAEDMAALGKTARVIHLLAAGELSLFQQLERAAGSGDALIAANFFEVVNDPETGSGNLTRLNFAREALWQLGKPILFWTDAGSMHAIANHAPDLYSQRRHTTVHFKGSFAIGVSRRLTREGWEQFLSSEEFAQIETAIELREKRLQGALGSAYPRRRLFSEIALPLAADYARLGLRDEAGRILEAFQDCTEALDEVEDLVALAAVQYALHGCAPALHSLQRASDRIGRQRAESGDAGYPVQWYDILIAKTRLRVECGMAQAVLPELDEAISRLRGKAEPEWTRRQLAVMLSLKADLLFERGQYPGAERLYAESLGISEQLSKDNPQSEQRRRDLSVSLDRIAYICEAQGRLAEAKRYYEQSLRIIEELSRSGPGAGALQRDLSVSLGNMGNIYRELGQPEQAAGYYERSLRIIERLRKANPNSGQLQRDLGTLLEKIGSSLRAAGKLADAKRYLGESLRIREALCLDNPGSEESERDLSVSLDYLGDACRESGETELAMRYYERSLEIAERLSRAHPHSEQQQRDLGVSLYKLAEIRRLEGKVPEALGYYRKGLHIVASLAAANPLSKNLRDDLARFEAAIEELQGLP